MVVGAVAAVALVVSAAVLVVPEERGGAARRVHAAPLVAPGPPQKASSATVTESPAAPAPAPAPRATPATARPVADRDGVVREVAADDGGAPVVALTFDDGPDPTWTPQVLDVLQQAGIHGTFCLVGTRVQRRPDLVRAIVADGNTVCDHTEHHVEHLDHRRRIIIEGEVGDGERAVANAGVSGPRYYRAPGGSLSPVVVDVAHRDGLAVLGWSVDPRDWKAPPAADIAGYVEAGVKPGSIVLFHDGGGDRSQTVEALRDVIATLSSRGYRFAALP